MKPNLRTAWFSCMSHHSPSDYAFDTNAAKSTKMSPKQLATLALTLLVLLPGREAFAQQYPQIGPSYEYAQYTPNQLPSYEAPAPVDDPQSYAQQPYAPPARPNLQPSMQALNAEQLEQLVAPIALYPDALLAIVLAASTYPAQVVQADHWLQAQGYASPDQIAAGANAQPWDPSVKALTAFPQVLAQIDQNLQWTTALGNAYFNQPQDVMEAVQVMRQRAQAAGNLQTTPQETVTGNQGNIALYPANPQVVYAPAYNPWTVYGQPISPYPGFSLLGALGSFFGSSPVQFGLGMVMSAFSNTPWGWLNWGLNWLTQSLLFHQSNYYSHSTTVANWHLAPGGMHVFSGMRAGSTYMPPTSGRDTYNAAARSGFGSGFLRQPARYGYGYGANRQEMGYNRSYQTPGFGYTARPQQEAYNRTQPYVSTPQQYARSGYQYGANNLYGRPAESFRGRSAPAYSSPMQAYHALTPGFPRNEFTQRSSGTFATRDFGGNAFKPEHSGGFHPGGHSPDNAYGSYKAPKGFNQKSFSAHSGGGFHPFGGGHSGGGSHFSSHGGGGHHHG